MCWNYLRPFFIVANASKCGDTSSSSSSSSSLSPSYAISLLEARTISNIVHRHVDYRVYRVELRTRCNVQAGFILNGAYTCHKQDDLKSYAIDERFHK